MDTDKRIVLAMAELMRVQGYAATSIKQLAEAAGATVGSIYHHFRGGKRDVAAEALRQSGAVYIQLLPLLLDPYENLAQGVRAAFEQAGRDLAGTGWVNLCPVGTVIGEIADTEPELRAVGAEVIESWIEQATAYLAGRGLAEPDARTAAYALIGALEGAFLLARGQHSAEPLVAAGRSVAAYLDTLPVTAVTP